MLEQLDNPHRASDEDKPYCEKAESGSRRLLSLLRKYHGEVVDNDPKPVELVSIQPEPVEINEAVDQILPPIPEKAIAEACKVAFPSLVYSHIETIQRAVLREFPKLSMADLKSPRREAPVVHARQVAMYLAKKLTAKSLPEIGRRFGGRDHTTVLHAVRKIDRKVAVEPDLAAQLERIKQTLPEFPI